MGKLQPIALGPLADIPLIGPVLFNNPPITYLAIILVFVVQFALFRTVWGLRTRAVGEHPSAADTVGINVKITRYINVTLAGAFAGLAGAYLTLEAVGSFERGMTNGRGFIALAVMIFGRWTPLGAWGAALLFGFFNAVTDPARNSWRSLRAATVHRHAALHLDYRRAGRFWRPRTATGGRWAKFTIRNKEDITYG